MARLTRVMVSSSRSTTSPLRTRVALAHQQLADDATGQVLHLLDVGVDNHGSGAITAPDSSVVVAQPPRPTVSSQRDDRAAQQVTADGEALVAIGAPLSMGSPVGA